MCRRVTCLKCQKPSFAGCGMHVGQVLRDVPPAQRCKCNERTTPATEAKRGSFLERLFG